MEKLKFNISVKAPREKVWKVLWDDATYRQWTSVFSPDSHAKSDWKEGSKIHFLDGKGNGMYSIIETKIGNTQMTFKHIGEIKNDVESPASSDWGDARESYFLSETENGTELRVELDAVGEFLDYFKEVFPKALQKVKELSEQGS
jgi:hypothetical protein